jgi:hypothetical protein
MAEDDKPLSASEIELAIQRASEKSPRLVRAREKISGLIGSNEDAGLRMLAEAIRRMMRQE